MRAMRTLAQEGHHIKAFATLRRGDATRLARESVESGADLILIAGGDGTINEALNGMVHSHVPLAVLPAGTANVLANELDLETSMGRTATRLARLVPQRISVGLLRGADYSRYFLLMAGVGLDAEIVRRVNLKLKKRVGKLAYWVAGFGMIARRLEQFEARPGEKIFPASFALASRVRHYGGGLQIARSASLLEDRFELVVFEGRHALRYLKYLGGVLTGRLERLRGVAVVQAQKVDFAATGDDRVHVQVDGEAAGRLPVTVEIVPDAVTLLMPSSQRRRLATQA